MTLRFLVLFSLFVMPAMADHAQVSLTETGVHFKMEPEWHVYWKNPGDSGSAPKFKFDVKGGSISGVKWPAPEKIKFGELANFGYEKEVTFPYDLSIDKGASSIVVHLELEYLICKVECVPEFKTLDKTFSLPLKDKVTTPSNARYPLPEEKNQVPLTAKASSTGFVLEAKGLSQFEIFPLDGSLFKTVSVSPQLDWAPNANRKVEKATFLIKYQEGEEWKAFEQEVQLQESRAMTEMLRAMLFAFMGGILLNLMPCVFPVLSIKVLTVVDEHLKGKALHRSGWLYSLGVVSTFVLLAVVLLVLRAGGEKLGWGFQLQSPRFVLSMAILFYVIGLNFLGAIEWGNRTATFAGGLFNTPLFHSSFGTGILSTLVATPCTAPFMGTALGASLLLPWWGSLLIFASLGSGMAAPFLLLCYSPKKLKLLPKPGAWMERVKEFFAFPLFATAAWLGWVLTRQSGADSVFILTLVVVLIGFGVWLKSRLGVAVAVLSIVLGIVLVGRVTPVTTTTVAASKSTDVVWQKFDPKKIEEVNKGGKPVFINFTASWCISCQWNKKSVLETQVIKDAFLKNGVELFEADWTNGDDIITEALESYGRNSVPLYVYLPVKGEKKILPEILTQADILGLF